ncbi:hypothetical protein ACFY3U_15585 [Micromonospora sp. NPDC000089]|uniref:hypothetical protein n=1 Tax=unclassified Micromonospora TaxID=2617518 RepID=UPI00367BB187
MTRSIRGSRRTALLLSGVAAATALLASGCGSGQVAETSLKEASVQGVSAQTADNVFKVRGLYVEYPGGQDYRAGANAPLNTVIYNDSPDPVTVTVTTQGARQVVLTGTAGSPAATASASASPSGSASPSAGASESTSPTPSAPTTANLTPSGSASPSATGSASASPSESAAAPAGEPARIEIPALGYVQLNVQGGRYLQLVGLNEELRSGQQVDLTFDFGNGRTISTAAPVGVPLTPAPQVSPIITREGGEGSSEEGSSGHGG